MTPHDTCWGSHLVKQCCMRSSPPESNCLVSFGARTEFQRLSARDGMALQRQSLMMLVMGGAGTEPDPAGLY